MFSIHELPWWPCLLTISLMDCLIWPPMSTHFTSWQSTIHQGKTQQYLPIPTTRATTISYYHGNPLLAPIFSENLVQYHWESSNWPLVIWDCGLLPDFLVELASTSDTQYSSADTVKNVVATWWCTISCWLTSYSILNQYYPNCQIDCFGRQALRWGQHISHPSTASCGAHEGHILPADITDKRRTDDTDLLKCYDV